MRNLKSKWLAAVAAAALGVAAAPAFAAAEAKPTQEPARASSFAGAYLAGRAAEADNDLTSAISYYKQALLLDPDNVALQQNIMLSLIAKGDFEAALPYAEKLKAVPEIEKFSRVALAIADFRKNNYKEAEYWLKLSLESDLDRLITGVMTAWAKAGAGDAEGALAHIETLQGPEWYGLFRDIHSALIADHAGLKDKAASLYQATADNRASADVAPEAWLRMIESYAAFLAREGKKDQALEVLTKVDEFSTARPTTLALRADIEAGRKPQPLVATPQEGAAEVLFDIASALNRGGGEAFVRIYLQYARALSPRNDAVLLQLGAVAEQQENLEEAIQIYRSVPEQSPLKRIAEMQMGLNLADLKKTDEAVKHLKVMVEQQPDDMRGYLALGGVYSASDNFAEAAKNYDRAVENLKDPQRPDWSIFYQRGIAYERLKEWDKAEPNFRKALELYPDQPQVLNYLGYSWIDMNRNLEEGLEMIRKAVEQRPSDGFIIDSLGWGYYRLGRFEEAVTELERAVALQPSDPVLNDHLGDAYWRVGRKLEARFQWSHSRDLKPEPDVLATVLEKLQKGLPELKPATIAALDQGNAMSDTPDGGNVPAPNATPEPVPAKTAEAPAPAGDAAAGEGSFRVGPGQSLWSIAQERLGSGERFREILDANPSLRGNPNLIYPGQELRLP